MTEQAPVTKRRAQTRLRLMSAAVEAFAERGVMAASVEDICERAGFTRGAFYSNFTDKDELVLALIDKQTSDVVDRTQRVIRESLADKTTAESDSEVLIERAADAFGRAQRLDRDSVVVQEELKLYAVRNPDMYEKYSGFERQTLRSIRELLTDALAQIGREFVLPIDDAIEFLAAAERHASLGAFLSSPGRRETDHPTRQLSQLLLILTRPMN